MSKEITFNENGTITFHTGSGMFHLDQPCMAYREEELMWKELYQNDMSDPYDEPPPDGWYDLCGHKYLEKIHAPSWVDAFTEMFNGRDKSIQAEIKLTGTQSPREYNYDKDAALFDLTISEATLQEIERQVFEHEEVFAQFLKEANSSYKGIPYSFRSFMPDTVEDWQYRYGTKENTYNLEYFRAAMTMLEFWMLSHCGWAKDCQWYVPPNMFQVASSIEEFRKELDDQIEKRECNGALQDCCEFHAKDSDWYKMNIKVSAKTEMQPA